MICESLIPDAAMERLGLLELVEAMRKSGGDDNFMEEEDMLLLLLEDEQINNIDNNQLAEMMQMLQMEMNNNNNDNNHNNNSQEVVLYEEDQQAPGNNYINNNYNQLQEADPNPNPRKRGMAPRSVWSPEEHEQFLIGFLKHGNKWKTIARYYVPSRSNIQIASHAQKCLPRKQQQANGPQASTSNAKPRKKRVSIHDTPTPLV